MHTRDSPHSSALAVDAGQYSYQPILFLDAALCHLAQDVLRHARDCGIKLVFVPARFTQLLQPLDVAASYGYKHWLGREFQLLGATAHTWAPRVLDAKIAEVTYVCPAHLQIHEVYPYRNPEP